jgi:hypothetical protein
VNVILADKHERDGTAGPRPATFVRACTHERRPDQAADKAELGSPGAGPEIDKYVAVERRVPTFHSMFTLDLLLVLASSKGRS